MKLFLLVALLTQAVSAVAQSNYDELKELFNPRIPSYIKALDQAKALKPIKLNVKNTVSKDFCKQLMVDISKNYKTNPFDANVATSVTRYNLCPESDKNLFFFDKVSGKTAFGRTYTQVFQQYIELKTDKGELFQFINTLFLDANFMMIEKSREIINSQTNEVRQFAVDSLDQSGNYFFNSYSQEVVNFEGPYLIQYYLPTDGSAGKTIKRETFRREDSSDTIESYTFYASSDQRWSSFELSLTLAAFGGFYTYEIFGDVVFDYPTTLARLLMKKVNGQEVCSVGTVQNYVYRPVSLKQIHFPDYYQYRECSDL